MYDNSGLLLLMQWVIKKFSFSYQDYGTDQFVIVKGCRSCVMKDAIKKIYERVKLATQGRWGPYSANLPFHAIVTKPAPSLSKHDTEEPTYWRCEDAIFVAHAVEDILYLLGELSEADVVCKQLIRILEDQKSQNKVA
jgi:hypothetical protein